MAAIVVCSFQSRATTKILKALAEPNGRAAGARWEDVDVWDRNNPLRRSNPDRDLANMLHALGEERHGHAAAARLALAEACFRRDSSVSLLGARWNQVEKGRPASVPGATDLARWDSSCLH